MGIVIFFCRQQFYFLPLCLCLSTNTSTLTMNENKKRSELNIDIRTYIDFCSINGRNRQCTFCIPHVTYRSIINGGANNWRNFQILVAVFSERTDLGKNFSLCQCSQYRLRYLCCAIVSCCSSVQFSGIMLIVDRL